MYIEREREFVSCLSFAHPPTKAFPVSAIPLVLLGCFDSTRKCFNSDLLATEQHSAAGCLSSAGDGESGHNQERMGLCIDGCCCFDILCRVAGINSLPLRLIKQAIDSMHNQQPTKCYLPWPSIMHGNLNCLRELCKWQYGGIESGGSTTTVLVQLERDLQRVMWRWFGKIKERFCFSAVN